MATKPWLRLFKKIRNTTYGPRAFNPIYEITSVGGLTYEVGRHRWVLPTHRWGWVARPLAGGRPIFTDTLDEMALELGHAFDEEA